MSARRQIILASGSPRRKELLQAMGLTFDVLSSDFDEYLDDARSVTEVAKELGLGKALAVAVKHPAAIVIGGDCIVSIGTHQYGKAKDVTEARQMLTEQGGQVAVVTSSVAVICRELGYERVASAQTRVFLKPANPGLIDVYLASGDWHDKAGAWGIQSGAAPLIDHIEGDLDTVIGLPTKILAELLAPLGIIAKPVHPASPVPQK